MKTNQQKIRITSRRFLGLCIAGVLFIVSGCGVKWWYGQLDILLRYRIDQYFDITGPQKDFITRQFKDHLVWHRYEGLPVHIRFLVATQKKVKDGLTRTEIGWFFTQYREQLRLLIDRLTDDSVQFLSLLSTEQIDYFSEKLTKENKKYEERLQMSKDERLKNRVEKTIESLEDWLGSLSEEQEAEITRLSLKLPDTFELWYQRRIQRQQRFISVLRENNSEEEVRQGLSLFMLPPDTENRDRTSGPFAEMVMAIDRMATNVQRQYLIDKLQQWIDDLKNISKPPDV